jgi:transcriptional regulator GlxA family with amidase domain
MSESSLVRAFKSVMGRPPMEHVIKVRVTRAAELLTKTDLKITDVAFRCGFSDSNYFSRQFKQVMNASPREYRKRGA